MYYDGLLFTMQHIWVTLKQSSFYFKIPLLVLHIFETIKACLLCILLLNKAMELITSHKPDACYLVDNRGWNPIHVAIANTKLNAVRFSLKKPRLESLINAVDNEGNTPLHLAHGRNKYSIIIILVNDIICSYVLQELLEVATPTYNSSLGMVAAFTLAMHAVMPSSSMLAYYTFLSGMKWRVSDLKDDCQ
ncbi:hypothetical protein FEM48_Zijuj04G0194500 [Ziziphus jujuba var. spinosa]|uniref:Uncharacterized protein n=1 Tax=Ziziphus jujuba var. spinosa TaxID=714518 RepID=A0A978VLR2_ZIZJJ|nr:hypothetical protein FEM48_Zijuj04G0194500 [Ziziphus jujuba var. spinosa]